MNFDTSDLVKITARDAMTKFNMHHFEPSVFNSDTIINPQQNDRGKYIDKYASKTYYVSDDEYFITDRIYAINNKDLIDNFTYILNRDGFRSQHFENFNQEDYNVLTAGCSFTFGVGLPKDYIWNDMMINHIGKKEKVENYDISYPGHSIYLIIKNVFSFIEKYGKPNKIFILFPDMHRSLFYSYKNENFNLCTISINHLTHKLDNEIKNAVMAYNEGTQLIHLTSYIHALEALCSALNIDLLWTTWNKIDAEKFSQINFKNFVDLDFFWPQDRDNILENTNDKQYWKIASDNSHPGSGWHEMYFDKLVKVYESRQQ